MSKHEVTIGDASVTFEQVEVDLDYNDILENIEDTIYQRVSDQITDEAWDATEYQVNDAISERVEDFEPDVAVTSEVQGLLLEYKNGPKPCGVGIAFEQAVWKAMCRLDNPDTHDSVWASAAKEYLLSALPQAPRSRDVRTIVREEMATVLLSFAKAVDAQLGAEIAVAPGG